LVYFILISFKSFSEIPPLPLLELDPPDRPYPIASCS
jgi:hypothetical protein